MGTTITISEKTRRRLADYKRGDSTFDDVLNRLMDRVPLEEVVAEEVEEHHRRLRDPDFVSVDEFKALLERRRRKSTGAKAVRGAGQSASRT